MGVTEVADGSDRAGTAPFVRIAPTTLRLSRPWWACSLLLLRGIEGIRACPAMGGEAVAFERPWGIDQATPILLLAASPQPSCRWTTFHRT